jgi:hypothetical protein
LWCWRKKTFFYRYSSPLNGKLVQLKIGNFPQVTLAEARMELQRLKGIRKQGLCPATELNKERVEEEQQKRGERLRREFTVRSW